MPNDDRSVAAIRSSRRLPLHGCPTVDIVNGPVALVQANGHVALLARAASIVGPMRVRTVMGKWASHGCLVKLTNLCQPKDGMRLRTRWVALGQFRYFNARTWAPVMIHPQQNRAVSTLDDS